MKKLKLTDDYSFNFDLIGITSSVKDYKLVWAINKHLHLNLARQNDHEISFHNKVLSYAFFLDEPTPEITLRIFSNKPVIHEMGSKSLLVTEAPHFDYICMREGESQTFSINSLLNLLKEVPVIEYLSPIDSSKMKNKEHFVF